MNQKFLSSLTATLLITTLGAVPSGSAKQPEAANRSSETNAETSSNNPLSHPSSSPNSAINSGEKSPKTNSETSSNKSISASTDSSNSTVHLTQEVVKVGQKQSQSANSATRDVIAKVYAHELKGRQAATLYVRNIPVLTFVGAVKVASESLKVGAQAFNPVAIGDSFASVKSLVNPQSVAVLSPGSQDGSQQQIVGSNPQVSQDDPVWRATEIAAKINQLNRDGLDASQITVNWDAPSNSSTFSGDRYTIKVSNTLLATVDTNTILPDTTRNLEADALEATNRLRRLLGDAAPLSTVSGKTNRDGQQLSLGPVQFQLNGMASWYGPGFDGALSASGEVFDQNDLTAAHRSLPFGTRVLVTNLDNGLSVLVRINDRGPYYGDRIIDLSAAAARVLGVVQTGVAPVRLDVLAPNSSLSAGR